jgi:hypothetical protein
MLGVFAKLEQIIDETVKAYTAGLIDGEGSISLSVRSGKRRRDGLPNQSPQLLLQVSMVDETVIDWLLTTWKVGHKHQSYRPKRPHHRPAFAWHVYGAHAATVLKQIQPYLKVKHRQAGLALEARQMIGPPSLKIGPQEMRRRWALRDQMIALNGTERRVTFVAGAVL